MAFVVLTLLGCYTEPPKKENYSVSSCYRFADCLYQNQKNPDKSVCLSFGMECNSWERFLFCKDDVNRPDRIDFEKCWLYLNQK